jgi:TPR repeat protein
MDLYRKACARDPYYGCDWVAAYYYSTNLASQAMTFAKRSCDAGLPRGCYVLGGLYLNEGDLPHAKVHYWYACERGFVDACKSRDRIEHDEDVARNRSR